MCYNSLIFLARMFYMAKILFLDLEETVIDDFFSANPINILKVRTFLKKEKFDEIRIFSFAISSDRDISRTQTIIIPMLEKLLEQDISKDIMTVGDMATIITKEEGIFFENEFELSLTFKKDITFLKICMHTLKNTEAVLLDDTVKNFKGCFVDKKLDLRMINILNNIDSELAILT